MIGRRVLLWSSRCSPRIRSVFLSSSSKPTIVETGARRINGNDGTQTFYKFSDERNEWEKQSSSSSSSLLPPESSFGLEYFLPTNYPLSVAKGYDRFAGFSFVASVAGSAAMVLSTQTLLLAVVVGPTTTEASVLAGAWNWVLKDGIGQLGGVWFASRMSQSFPQNFDADPKRWRMWAALSLDAAALLEITSPLLLATTASSSSWIVLAVASVANTAKNIGFLTASASRAALHQALATNNNLADVTAKTGSQSILASLVGTSVGLSLSMVLQQQQQATDIVPHAQYCWGFLVLSLIHQTGNYMALRSVPLTRLNRHRLHLVLDRYLRDNNTNCVLSPQEVAREEQFLPGFHPDDTHTWLVIGSGVSHLGGPEAVLEELKDGDNQHIVRLSPEENKIHLGFRQDATGEDCVKGMLCAHRMHRNGQQDWYDDVQGENDDEKLLAKLKHAGWNLESVDIESKDSVRLSLSEEQLT